MIILIAAFNGIEKMVDNMYSEFDSNIIIQSKNGKTFPENLIDYEKIRKIKEVQLLSKTIEEIVILKHEKKWINAKMIGVEQSFLRMANVDDHIIDGKNLLTKNGQSYGIIGAGALDRLNAYIHEEGEYENILVFFPRRNAKVNSVKSPFRSTNIQISSRINYNKEVNDEAIIIPIELAKEMLGYNNEITGLNINLKNKIHLDFVKNKIQKIVGNSFEVKTYMEKNKLIYQTSKSEKLIVIFILIFVFILAVFNLVSSLTMMFIEKKSHIKTLASFGFSKIMVFKTFILQGIFIALKGIFYGCLFGGLVIFLQIKFSIIILPNSNNQAFPIVFSVKDNLIILFVIFMISLLATLLTVLFLIKTHQKETL